MKHDTKKPLAKRLLTAFLFWLNCPDHSLLKFSGFGHKKGSCWRTKAFFNFKVSRGELGAESPIDNAIDRVHQVN